jgi:hypothetical protein
MRHVNDLQFHTNKMAPPFPHPLEGPVEKKTLVLERFKNAFLFACLLIYVYHGLATMAYRLNAIATDE